METISFRFVQCFKKRQNLIAISEDELKSFSNYKAWDIFLKTRAIIERYFACQFGANCGKVIIESVWQSGRIRYWNTIQTQLTNRGPARFARSKLIDHLPRFTRVAVRLAEFIFVK